jgi:hypothetical protein
MQFLKNLRMSTQLMLGFSSDRPSSASRQGKQVERSWHHYHDASQPPGLPLPPAYPHRILLAQCRSHPNLSIAGTSVKRPDL